MQDRISKTSQNHTSAPKSNPFQTRGFGIDTPKKSATPATDIDFDAQYEHAKRYALDLSNVPVFPPSPVQAKLTIGQPGDKYEQEADQVASQVVQQINAPASVQAAQGQPQPQQQEELEEELQAKPEISSLQRMEELEEELQAKSTVQRREAIGGGEASQDLDTAINSSRGSGQPLDAGLQRSMGQAMGADFSGVKVHTDAQSDQLNRSIQARAFTTGQDVFFRQGAYDPGSRGGQELIAHELTHVVQQNGGAVQRSLMQTKKESIQTANILTVQLWPDGTTRHLRQRASERSITEAQIDNAVNNGAKYDDADYPGGTIYYDSSTGVTVCEVADRTKTTCYVSSRPKSRWTLRV
ncbi:MULTISPECIES: DUF4157 domain-containing protein [unclassified Anabaena]|uniref:eCIS core domain-containing protein n=1 Tax=unclassified Anabaena TaxID=2619674 RepID=UPI001446585D|nr:MULTISPECIES: DUF4157 domain-containing protein [unclassified Anabaena]MTJ07878.1 DUF4157 domain-containing protein [Anabaena sp. UHCC 0204]MTJ53642.1 DUF4157 domain-containing protein [Anabaena sp. UHCC 0253]